MRMPPSRLAALLWLLMTTFLTDCDAFLLGGRGNDLDNFIERSLPHDGLTRWFLEYKQAIPINNSSTVPLVLLLHGGTNSMRTLFQRSRKDTPRWLSLSDRDNFVLLVPNGVNQATGDTKGDEQNWNDLRDDFGANTVDDVGFLAALVNWAVNVRGGVNPNRVYITGASNGGMMSFRAMIESPIYAAGAAFIASLPDSTVPTPNRSTPVFIMNGNKDKLVKWEGGTVGSDRGAVRSALATRDYWIQVNGADASKVQRSVLPNRRRLDGCRISSEFYPALATTSNNSSNITNATISNAPVHFYTMDGGGHMIPFTEFGFYSPLRRFIAGPACRDVNGVDLAWEFMSRYTRQQ